MLGMWKVKPFCAARAKGKGQREIERDKVLAPRFGDRQRVNCCSMLL